MLRTALISRRLFATANTVWTKKPNEEMLPAVIRISDGFNKDYKIRKDIQKLRYTEHGLEGKVLDNDGDEWTAPDGWNWKTTKVQDKHGTFVRVGTMEVTRCGCKGIQDCAYYYRGCVGQRSKHRIIRLRGEDYAMSFEEPAWSTPPPMLQTIEDHEPRTLSRYTAADPFFLRDTYWDRAQCDRFRV